MESNPPVQNHEEDKQPEAAPAAKIIGIGYVTKPKKPTSAWIYFNTEMVAKLKVEKSMDQKEAFTKSAEIWKSMNEEDKAPHVAKSKQDEERYKRQVKELAEDGYFMLADGRRSTELYVEPKKKFGEDCLLPKKPLSSYLFYTTENVNKLKERENCSHTEAMKKCGQLWNGLEADEKQKYQDMHDKDITRYKAQMDHLDKNGYFTMPDGSKSSDHKNPKAKKRAKKGEEKPEKAKKQKKE